MLWRVANSPEELRSKLCRVGTVDLDAGEIAPSTIKIFDATRHLPGKYLEVDVFYGDQKEAEIKYEKRGSVWVEVAEFHPTKEYIGSILALTWVAVALMILLFLIFRS